MYGTTGQCPVFFQTELGHRLQCIATDHVDHSTHFAHDPNNDGKLVAWTT